MFVSISYVTILLQGYGTLLLHVVRIVQCLYCSYSMVHLAAHAGGGCRRSLKKPARTLLRRAHRLAEEDVFVFLGGRGRCTLQ